MNKKEIAELKKRFRKEQASFTRMAGCYVGPEKQKICKFAGRFLTLEEEEFYKYLEIAGKVLSGTLGNNMLNLEFPLAEEMPGGRQQILMNLRECDLENEEVLDAFYDHVIETYAEVGNYLILLYLDNYDVMTRTKDNIDLDESTQVYKYILCAICPVSLAKPGLAYNSEEARFESMNRDWVVGMPDTGFLFPAFNDRSTDIHATLFYTKNAKEPHTEFMTEGLGCREEKTATEQKISFHSIVRGVLGEENPGTDETLLDIQQNLSEIVAESEMPEEEAEPLTLTGECLKKVFEDSKVSEMQSDRILKEVDKVFADKMPPVKNVIDNRALANNEYRLEKLALEDELEEMSKELEAANTRLEEKKDELAARNADLLMKDTEISARDEEIAQLKGYVPEEGESMPEIVLQVSPEKAGMVYFQVIDGQKCLVVPMEDGEAAAVNGVKTAE